MDRSFPTALAKTALRGEALGRRDGLDPSVRQAASAAIARRAVAVAVGARPTCLATYLPVRSEVDPGPIIDWALNSGIDVVLPAVVDATTIVFRRYRPGDALANGGLGTLAPVREALTADPDLIVSPVVAFDRTGARLGHGRGYYDRAIAMLRARGRRPLFLGVAFAVQEVVTIPSDPHDARLDVVATENETLDFRKTA
ncbi:MAG: 5-formyltetrahydrofolate cyclo-ligase [Bauldia sp.]